VEARVPIVHENAAEYDGLCLTIWCTLENSQRPAGAERIAQIIGPLLGLGAGEWRSKAALPPRTISCCAMTVSLSDKDRGFRANPRSRVEPEQENSLGA